MPLINTSVPNLIQGVSQQPDALKFDGQCKEQENAFSSVADGLRKRPNTNLVKWVDEELGDNPFIHSINRSETEKYLLIITGTKIKVFNVDGTEATIGGATGGVDTSSFSYLDPSNPKSDLKALTVGDTTWIVNTTTTTQMDTAASTAQSADQALIFIKRADYNREYSVTATGVTKTAITDDDADASNNTGLTDLKPDTGIIASGLAAAFDGEGNFSATSSGATIKLTRTGGDALTLSTKDPFGDGGIGVVFKEVSSITDLPVIAPDGFRVKVKGDPELNEDDYYVKFETNEGLTSGNMGRGSWVEDIGYGVTTTIKNTTMPYKLVSTAANTFTLSASTWTARAAGDTTSNPNPSFIGQKLSNLFFYKNRLGVLSEDKVVMSEAGEYFNFFRTTVTTLLDSAPIDIAVASTNVTNLESTVGFQENLVLFSNKGQFVLRGGDLLTSETVSITPITNFDQTTGIDPVPLGSFAYFPFTRGNFSGMREFAVSSTGDTYNAEEITSHVPSYIPKNIIDITGSSNEEVIAVLSSEQTDTLYIYKYYWSGREKVLSSWSKFNFTGCEIKGIEFIDSTLYLVVDRNFTSYGSANPEGSDDEYYSGPASTVVAAGGGKDFMILSMVFTAGLPQQEDLADGTNLGFVTHLDYRVERKIPAGQTKLFNTSVDSPALQKLDYYPLESNEFPDGIEETDTGRLTVIDRATGVKIPFTRTVKTGTDGVKYLDDPNELICTSSTTDRDVFVGVTYDTTYTFSEQLFKTTAGKNKTPTKYTRSKIKNGTIFYNDSVYFQVKVTPEYRDTFTNEFNTQLVSISSADRVELDSGSYTFPVFTKPEDTTITIQNNSPYPSTFQNAEFESFVHSRSNRYA
jgi:hypothetical protein